MRAQLGATRDVSDQSWENFFHKGPDTTHFKLCRSRRKTKATLLIKGVFFKKEKNIFTFRSIITIFTPEPQS